VASASAQNDLTDDQRDFIKFDTNFDGKLDAQELRIGLNGEIDDFALHDFFQKVDKDKDGTFTLDEFVAHELWQ